LSSRLVEGLILQGEAARAAERGLCLSEHRAQQINEIWGVRPMRSLCIGRMAAAARHCSRFAASGQSASVSRGSAAAVWHAANQVDPWVQTRFDARELCDSQHPPGSLPSQPRSAGLLLSARGCHGAVSLVSAGGYREPHRYAPPESLEQRVSAACPSPGSGMAC
jgi:hypothetical protein